MIEKKDVEKLAALARITIPENEIEKVRQDMEKILAYVGHLDEATLAAGGEASPDAATAGGDSAGAGSVTPETVQYNFGVKNVLREDGEPHESGEFTERLLACAPKTERGYVKVKKIL